MHFAENFLLHSRIIPDPKKNYRTLANTTKLKIDLTQGTLDVEGSERFVKEIYKEFKERLEGPGKRRKGKGPKNSSSAKPSTRKAPAGHKPKLVQELNLKPQGKTSLQDFFRSFKKLSRNEKFLVYVIYMKDHLGLTKITADHIYTCMREVHDKVPATLKQIISNAKTKTGWFEIRNGTITYSSAGKQYYESELKRKLKAA